MRLLFLRPGSELDYGDPASASASKIFPRSARSSGTFAWAANTRLDPSCASGTRSELLVGRKGSGANPKTRRGASSAPIQRTRRPHACYATERGRRQLAKSLPGGTLAR